MNIASLTWYRENINYTENSIKAQRQPILYFDSQRIGGGRNRFVDVIPSKGGLKFFGTPGEYSALYKTSKYISVVSPPNAGKIWYVDYPADTRLTSNNVFPGIQENNNGRKEASPFHTIKLYFPGRASLRLETNPNSPNYKNWI